MIRADQIPDEVVFALLDIYTLWLGDTDQARAAIAAALSAWPGVTTTSWFEGSTRKAVLNIPLPQEVIPK